MIRALVSFGLRRRVIVLALLGIFVAAGVAAFVRLPVEAYPDVTNVQVQLITIADAQIPQCIHARVRLYHQQHEIEQVLALLFGSGVRGIVDALLCNTLIDAVNAKWGSTIPRLNVSNYATVTSSRMQVVGGNGQPAPMRIDGLDEGLRTLFPSRR